MASEVTKVNSGAGPADGTQLPVDKMDLLEDYTPQRVAEFLLNNAVGRDGYLAAREEVRKLGIDPDSIPHEPPPGV